jgi:hypothetical protein
MSKKALGKGIDALMGDGGKSDPSSLAEVRLSLLKPNPHQPRQEFDDASLRELADSIREKGVLQPILAEADQEGAYFIIAGERRVRAAKLAGLDRIPVIVRQFSAEEKLEIALIENVQREDLTPIEQAHAYRRLMEMATSQAARGGAGRAEPRQHKPRSCPRSLDAGESLGPAGAAATGRGDGDLGAGGGGHGVLIEQGQERRGKVQTRGNCFNGAFDTGASRD